MRDSVRLGSVNGIPIGLHWSVALVATFLIVTLTGSILPAIAAGYSAGAYLVIATGVTVAFLASIVAHELGHSIVAQRNDVNVRGITLFALGGVAKLEREPDNAGAAARIALAGPAVSVAIGVAGVVGWALTGALGLPSLVVATLGWFGLINLGMAVFNMIPALPLDGGRTLQAALWHRRGDRERATISAANIGRYLGWAMVAFGLWLFLNGGGGLWYALIGWFVASSARAEGARARFELQRRNWAPPAWPQFLVDPGFYRYAATGRRPGPSDRPGDRDDVVDVTGRPAG
ncbi:MAG: site-2 protease family protein [Actinomycetota bacterium]